MGSGDEGRHPVGVARTVWGRGVATSDRTDIRTGAVALAVALFGLNVLDIIVTRFNIDRLGGREINGLMAPLLGTPWEFGLKFGFPLAIIVLASAATSSRMLSLLRVAVAVYLVVAIIGVGQIAYVLV
jgi:hypothetical protein